MRSKIEIQKQLETLRQDKLSGLPYSELKTIAWHGTKQALEWVLGETDDLLTYKEMRLQKNADTKKL